MHCSNQNSITAHGQTLVDRKPAHRDTAISEHLLRQKSFHSKQILQEQFRVVTESEEEHCQTTGIPRKFMTLSYVSTDVSCDIRRHVNRSWLRASHNCELAHVFPLLVFAVAATFRR